MEQDTEDAELHNMFVSGLDAVVKFSLFCGSIQQKHVLRVQI
jgi:hypothetical protein